MGRGAWQAIVHWATKSQAQLTQDIHPLFSKLISELLLLFSYSVGFDSLRPHTLQHARLSCPLLSLEVCSNSCTLSQWCHSTVSSSVTSFLCLQSFPASGSFPMSQLFASAGQSIGASVLPMNTQGWFPWGFTGFISLLSKRHSRVFSSTTVWKHQFFGVQPSLWSNSHICTRQLKRPQLWLYSPLSIKWHLWFLIHYLGLS